MGEQQRRVLERCGKLTDGQDRGEGKKGARLWHHLMTVTRQDCSSEIHAVKKREPRLSQRWQGPPPELEVVLETSVAAMEWPGGKDNHGRGGHS